MKFEDLFQYIGDFGKYQKRVYFIAASIAIASAFQQMVVVFSLTEPKHRCAIPGLSNDTFVSQGERHEQLLNLSIPWETDVDGTPVRSKCKRYDLNYTGNDSTHIIECTAWVYDKTVFDETVISQFNLVCSDKQKQSHAKMMMFGGTLIGGLGLGALSDRFGRKKILVGSVLFHVGASVASSFSPSYYVFILFRFLVGLAHPGLYTSSFIIGMEFVGPSRRAVAGIGILFYWSLGQFILGGVAYVVRSWHYLHLAMSVPNIIFVSFYWLLPESPRWLLQKERFEEAEAVIRKAANFNKVNLPEKIFNKDSLMKRCPQGKITDLFTSRTHVFRSIAIFFNWLVVSMTYYGLGLNVSNLSGDIYVNFVIASAVETVSYVLTILLLDRVGRKKIHCVSMATGGVACVLTIFPVLYAGSEKDNILITLTMIGKMGASAAFSIIWIFTAELFPTFVRQTALGWGTFVSKSGSIISPYVADLHKLFEGHFAASLPMLVFGGASIAAAIMSLWLPETLHKPIPDTVEDVKCFETNRSDISSKNATDTTEEVKESYLLAESPRCDKPETDVQRCVIKSSSTKNDSLTTQV